MLTGNLREESRAPHSIASNQRGLRVFQPTKEVAPAGVWLRKVFIGFPLFTNGRLFGLLKEPSQKICPAVHHQRVK